MNLLAKTYKYLQATNWIRHLGLWLFVFISYSLILALQCGLPKAMLIAGVNVPFYALAYYVMRQVQIPFLAKRGKYFLFSLSVLISTILLFFFYAGVWKIGYGTALGYDKKFPLFYFAEYLLMSIRFYSPTAVLLALEYQRKKHDEMQRIELLEKERISNELKFLKAQINPHFLFNTLNNLYSYVVTQSPKAEDMIVRLSSILDYVFNKSQSSVVELSEEVKAIQNFIELERIRYGDRLEVSCEVSEELNVGVSPLILLSLVENAFKHGASGDIDEPKIKIRISVQNNQIDCQVWNTKSAYQGELNDAYKEGIGLSNIKKQLNLIYPDNYSLNISDRSDSFDVMLRLTIA